MTSTAEIVADADVAPAPPPRCEIRWACANKCCPPTRCPDRAQYRVSFGCASPACIHPDLVLLCERCSARADTLGLGRVLARRPL